MSPQICEVCSQASFKYRCAFCRVASCSLSCFKSHAAQCSASDAAKSTSTRIVDPGEKLEQLAPPDGQTLSGQTQQQQELNDLFVKYPLLQSKLLSIYEATQVPPTNPSERPRPRPAYVQSSVQHGAIRGGNAGSQSGSYILRQHLSSEAAEDEDISAFADLVLSFGSTSQSS